jgi:hypothetical protein
MQFFTLLGVFDAGVGVVLGFQGGQLAEFAGRTTEPGGEGVGGEELVTPAAGFLEQGQLCAGV